MFRLCLCVFSKVYESVRGLVCREDWGGLSAGGAVHFLNIGCEQGMLWPEGLEDWRRFDVPVGHCH